MSAHEKPPHTTQPTAPDTLYASGAVDEDFTFNDRVAEVFDDMLSRSIPSYRTVIEGTAQLLARPTDPRPAVSLHRPGQRPGHA